jgi:hypothetical protein
VNQRAVQVQAGSSRDAVFAIQHRQKYSVKSNCRKPGPVIVSVHLSEHLISVFSDS